MIQTKSSCWEFIDKEFYKRENISFKTRGIQQVGRVKDI